MSFLLYYCHSFRIIVIPSGLLSFLPDYCYSLRIIVIPSKSLPFHCHSFRIIVIPSESLLFQIFVILNSFCTLPYPKGETIGQQSRPYLRVFISLEKLGHTNFVVAMLSVTNHIYHHILVESSTVFSGNTANMNNSLGICKKKTNLDKSQQIQKSFNKLRLVSSSLEHYGQFW